MHANYLRPYPDEVLYPETGFTLLWRCLLVWPANSFGEDMGCKRADTEGASLLPDELDAWAR